MAWISDSKPPLAVSRSALSIYYIEREIIARDYKIDDRRHPQKGTQ